MELLGVVDLVVRRRDPRPAHLDLADRLAVPRHRGTAVVGDAQLDAGQDATRARPPRDLVVAAPCPSVDARWRTPGSSRSCPSPAPRARGTRRGSPRSAPAARPSRRTSPAAATTDRRQRPLINRSVSTVGTAPVNVGRVSSMIRAKRAGLEELLREDEVGTDHPRRVRRAPGVGVEHRHDHRHPVALGRGRCWRTR